MRTTSSKSNRWPSLARPMLLIMALLASSLASLAAVAGTVSTARACSIAGPYVEVWPSVDLQPGQQLEVVGWGFNDIRLHASSEAPPTRPTESALALPPEACDFDVVPLQSLDVYWQGTARSWLAQAVGPDFAVVVTVPLDAAPGTAWITVGSVEVAVSVAGDEPAPPLPSPCALAAQPNAADEQRCPDPWPCPLYGAADTQPAPDYAPGFQPPCPEPCVDYAHTIDDGTVYDYRWDCPDPCSQTQVSPGAGDEALAIWCPPPDPCPMYVDGGVVSEPALVGCPDPCGLVGGDAVWCPPPDPCPMYVDGGVVPEPALVGCPDPCSQTQVSPGAGDEALALWCPPPDPCGLVGGDAVWCPPPCAALGGPGDSSAQYCPEPCPFDGAAPTTEADALVWCPPACELVGGDALVCPEPCLATANGADHWCGPADETTTAALATDSSPPESAPSLAVNASDDAIERRAASAASNIIESLTSRLRTSITGVGLVFFN